MIRFFKILFILLMSAIGHNTYAVDINYSTDYINAVYDVPANSTGTLITKYPGYNFFITHIDISSNCYEINCTNIFYDFDLYDSGTGSHSGTGGEWVYTIKEKKAGEYENIVNILFKNNLFIKNNNQEARVYIRLEGYFLKENATSYDFYNTAFNFLTSDESRTIKSIVLINIFLVFLLVFFIRNGFKTGSNYFLKKINKGEK